MGHNEQIFMEVIKDIDKDIVKNDTLEDDKSLVYEKRLRSLIYDISKHEDFEGIQITKDGLDRIEKSSKYVISMIIFEIIEELKNSNRKQIKSSDVNKALDKILHKVSAIDHVILMLKEDMNKLEMLRDISITSKVDSYINDI